MADQFDSESNIMELSPPTSHGKVEHGVGGVMCDVKIDKKLLIDPHQLYIKSAITEGDHSVVYEGLYKSKPVAIKVLTSNKSAVNPVGKVTFVREVTMLSRVKHDNIVKFIGASMEPMMVIVTELMRGGTLRKYLLDIRPTCPDLKLSMNFALGISRAMECLHENGIIHRDLKPSNLLLTEDKNKIKLADFGSAREETTGEMTTETGTYRWMAPEVYSRDPLKVGMKKHYDHKVDVYSFSMILWELLTNKIPFKGKGKVEAAYAAAINERPSIDDIPKDIAPLLQSCWAEDPTTRPEFAQITQFLVKFLRGLCTPQTTPPRPLEIEYPESNVTEDSTCTNRLMDKPEENSNKNTKSPCGSCLSCFDDCL